MPGVVTISFLWSGKDELDVVAYAKKLPDKIQQCTIVQQLLMSKHQVAMNNLTLQRHWH